MWRPSITPTDVIMHTGVKGMKWGKRQYQNPDGSLTPLGREHYGVGNQWKDAKGNSKHTSSRASGVGNNRSNGRRPSSNDVKNTLNAGGNIASNSANLAAKASQASKRKARNEIDLSNMSDKELRKAINRMALEKQYKDLATMDKRTGYDTLSDILSVAGSVAAIGASGAMIYSVLKK